MSCRNKISAARVRY